MNNIIIRRLKNVREKYKHFSIVCYYNFIYRNYSKVCFNKNLKNNIPPKDYLHFFSDNTRFIEILPQDYCLKEVLFSCYFIHKENPQTGETFLHADFNYIKPWYESVKKLNINAIIIHDGLEQKFIDIYQTEKIKFRKFNPGRYPLIDERWIFYFEFIKNTNIRKAFFTDIGDVIVTSNPLLLITEENDVLFIGRDNANKIRLSGWILNEISKFKNEFRLKIPVSFYYQSLYNVGIVGGNRKVVLFLLSKVIKYLFLSECNFYREMTIFNLVIHKYFFPKIKFSQNESVYTYPENDSISSHANLISGYPLNSEFKKFQYDSKAVFIHK